MLRSGLYIISTPIGNLQDISARALEILREASVIAGEDTRVSKKLFSLLGIGLQKKFVTYQDHNEEEMAQKIADLAAEQPDPKDPPAVEQATVLRRPACQGQPSDIPQRPRQLALQRMAVLIVFQIQLSHAAPLHIPGLSTSPPPPRCISPQPNSAHASPWHAENFPPY